MTDDNRPSGNLDGVVRLRVSDEELEGWLTPAGLGEEKRCGQVVPCPKPDAGDAPATSTSRLEGRSDRALT